MTNHFNQTSSEVDEEMFAKQQELNKLHKDYVGKTVRVTHHCRNHIGTTLFFPGEEHVVTDVDLFWGVVPVVTINNKTVGKNKVELIQ